jgi:hypothetical protein
MTDKLPELFEIQFRKASEACQLFPPLTFLGFILSSLFLDVLLVAGGWVIGSPSRVALTLVGIDALLLGVWIIGIPFRRWLARSPY